MTDRELYWDKYESPIVVASYNGVTESLTLGLITLMMHQNDKFVAVMNSTDEMTVCYDETLAPHFTCYKDKQEIYIAYKLMNTGSLMEEAGLVKKTSTLFTDNGIPILYMTTWNNNYVLVPVEHSKMVDQMINVVQSVEHEE